MMIVVTMLKGGTGKTTIAMNLAAELAKRGRTAVVELDYQQAASTVLGLHNTHSLADLMDNAAKLSDTLVKYSDNFYVLPSGGRMMDIERTILGYPDKMFRFKELVSALKKAIEYVVVDTHPDSGVLTTLALAQADIAVVVTKPGIQNTVSVERTMKVLSNVMYENKKLKVVIVNNLVREGTKIGQSSLHIISKRYGDKVSKVVIPMATLFERAEVDKKPLVVAYPDRREAGLFVDLVDEIMSRGTKMEAVA